MPDREKVINYFEDELSKIKPVDWWVSVRKDFLSDALTLLKEQEAEYENGFNDAMLGKQELMYEGTDGKLHKKDW